MVDSVFVVIGGFEVVFWFFISDLIVFLMVCFDVFIMVGDFVIYQWDFGDGCFLLVSVNNVEVSYIYQGLGIFQVWLMVRKDDFLCLDGWCVVELICQVMIGLDVVEGFCQFNDNMFCLCKNCFELKMIYDMGDEMGDVWVVVQQLDDLGFFWFFVLDNWEVMVKVIDGCLISGNFWVFGVVMIDLGYIFMVIDISIGDFKEYVNLFGNLVFVIFDL